MRDMDFMAWLFVFTFALPAGVGLWWLVLGAIFGWLPFL